MTVNAGATIAEQCEEILRRIASDLSLVTDKTVRVESVAVEQATRRPAAGDGVHISFKLGFRRRAKVAHGCWLVPLAGAVSLAGHLTLLSDDAIEKLRSRSGIDQPTKEALLEVGQLVGSAADAALHGLGLDELEVRSESCQGVRAHARPAFQHADGSALTIARARWSVQAWPAFEAALMLPAIEG